MAGRCWGRPVQLSRYSVATPATGTVPPLQSSHKHTTGSRTVTGKVGRQMRLPLLYLACAVLAQHVCSETPQTCDRDNSVDSAGAACGDSSVDVARLRTWMQDILTGNFLTEQLQPAEGAAECGAARRDEAGVPLQGWVSATTAEGELTRRYQGGCEVAGSWVTLDTEAGTIGTTAGGGVGAWLLYRGGENALYTPALAPPSSSCPSPCSRARPCPGATPTSARTLRGRDDARRARPTWGCRRPPRGRGPCKG